METDGKYKIIDIREVTDKKYGKTIFVKANPINKIGGMLESFTPYECKETRCFILPLSMADSIVDIAQSEKIWTVEFINFIKERIISDGQSQIIFRHLSFHKDEIFLKYTAEDVSFDGGMPNQSLGEDHWAFYKDRIVTPQGVLTLDSFLDVNNSGQIGIQFSTRGMLRINEINVNNNPHIAPISIKTLAMVRQPHNAWVYAWLFDNNDQPVMTVCGFDGIDNDGLYLLHKYQLELHKLYK